MWSPDRSSFSTAAAAGEREPVAAVEKAEEDKWGGLLPSDKLTDVS